MQQQQQQQQCFSLPIFFTAAVGFVNWGESRTAAEICTRSENPTRWACTKGLYLNPPLLFSFFYFNLFFIALLFSTSEYSRSFKNRYFNLFVCHGWGFFTFFYLTHTCRQFKVRSLGLIKNQNKTLGNLLPKKSDRFCRPREGDSSAIGRKNAANSRGWLRRR